MNGYKKTRYDADAVKAAVPMSAAIERYADPGKRRGRCPCPIHGGKDDNMSYNSSQYHCFVCGAGGDVIDFVMRLFNLSFVDAVAKLAVDFGIAPGVDPVAVEKRQEANRRRKAAEQHEKDNFRILADFYHQIDDYPDSQLKCMFKNSLAATLDNIIASGDAAKYDANEIVRVMKDALKRAAENGHDRREKA